MSKIFVAGIGAVSPAGWNVAALRDALEKGEPLPVSNDCAPRLGKTAANALCAEAVCAS